MSKARIIRDIKAYTLLKHVVDELRTVGQYVFWRNDNRLKGYGSRYSSTHRRKSQSGDEIVRKNINQ